MNNIKKLREKENLSLRDLADKLDINYATIWKAETGYREPSKNLLELLSKYFNVTEEFILGIEDIEKSDLIRKIKNNIHSQDEIKKVSKYVDDVIKYRE